MVFVCLVVLFLGMVTTASTAKACSNPKTFGDNCEYHCHCTDGVACGTDGSCSDGCGRGWEGEYCQRGDVAAGKSSSTTQSSTNDSYSASLALDGSANQAFSSCSHTNTEDQPWWKVDLGKEYVLLTVNIANVFEGDVRECKATHRGTEYRGTMSTTRKGFTCADWNNETIGHHSYKPANSTNYCRNPDNTDEPWCYTTDNSRRWDFCNVPKCYTKLKNFKIMMDGNLCHHYTGAVGFGREANISCDTPVVGRYLKIKLMDSLTILTLCEVTVQAFQYKACHNGYYGPNCKNRCQCANDDPCDDKTGKCPSGCNDRFTGPYCNIVSKNGFTTQTSVSVNYTTPHGSRISTTGPINITSEIPTVSNYSSATSTPISDNYTTPYDRPIDILEVCDTGTFSYNCQYQCHCDGGDCGRDGSCPYGCARGWKGEYCQRGYVAAGKSSRATQSSTNDSYSASLAIDGSANQAFSKCSHTNTEDKPWWQVDLGMDYVLFTVDIVNVFQGDVRECKTTQSGTEYRGTMSTTRKGFTCADWNDETIHHHLYKPANSANYCRNPDNTNEPWCYTTDDSKTWDQCSVPLCYTKLKNFKIIMDGNLCHHHNGAVEFGYEEHIRCDTPVVGRYLKIQLMDSSTVLTLCEVIVEAFQYEACRAKRYGPNCNNRCQCANDDPCDDTTGKCLSGCNDRFTGPYCNVEIPTVSKNGPSTPNSISVKWTYTRPHDSAYDAGDVASFDLRYNSTTDSSSGYLVSSPYPRLMTANLTGLQPSTQYSFRIQVRYRTSNMANDEYITSPLGPIANFQTESCAGYMVKPVITVLSNKILTGLTLPNRVSLVIKAELPNMIAECIKQLNVYSKKTTESDYVEWTKAGQTYTIIGHKAFTDYVIKATVRSPDGKERDGFLTIKATDDVSGPPSTLLAEKITTTSLALVWNKPKDTNGILKNYKVTCTPLFSYNEDVNAKRANYAKEYNAGLNVMQLMVTGLTPATEYNCSVAAQTSKGFGPSAWVRNYTKPEEAVVPENLFPSIFPGKTTDSTITVEVLKMPKSLKTGSISKVRIAVEKQGKRRKRSTPLQKEDYDNLTDYATAHEKGYPGYIAAELVANFTGAFIIGDGKKYGGYYNAPLEKGQSYYVIFGMLFTVRWVPAVTVAYRRYGKPITVIAGPNYLGYASGFSVGALIVLAVIIIAVVVWKRREEKKPTADPTVERENAVVLNPLFDSRTKLDES